MAQYNQLFVAVVIAGAALALYRLFFHAEGLSLGYGLITIGLVSIAALLWRRRPNA